MESNKITFIIPNRGGTQIDFVIGQLKKYYGNAKFIVITQDDDKPFMRGQLWNIAYGFVDTEYMCFIDNDMFFPEFIDLIGIYNSLNCMALQPFKNIRQVKINGNNVETISEAPKNKYGKGGSTFISKANFEKVGGMSNLYVGYGCEDTDFDYRCGGIADIDNVICHIQHPRRNNDTHWDINKRISAENRKRETKYDNYTNTKYIITQKASGLNILGLKVKDITTNADFKYINELKLHEGQ